MLYVMANFGMASDIMANVSMVGKAIDISSYEIISF